MAQCACKQTADLRAVIIHDLSQLPAWRIVALSTCVHCIEKHRLCCRKHKLIKICITNQPAAVYAAHLEALSRVCHHCVLDAVRKMDVEEKRRLVSLTGAMSNLDIIGLYIPQQDRPLLAALSPIDLTVFGLLFGAELEGMTLHEVAEIVAKVKHEVGTPAGRPLLN